MAVRAQSTV